MMRILNRHSEYEALLTEHVDGVISAADDAKLSAHLASCADCATDLREQIEVRALLRAEPLVDVPRSFALPYAPRTIDAGEPSGITKLLRGMQVATATAAMVLVALVGLSVIQSPASQSAASDASAPLAASVPESESLKTAAGTERSSGPVGATGAAPEADTSISLASPPPADAILEFAPSTETIREPAITEGIDGGLPETDDTLSLGAAAALDANNTPEFVLATDATPNDDRPALEWALLAASTITALLALAVVVTTWRTRQT